MLLSHKNNKIIPFAARGMDLETVILTVILSELSWTEEDKSYVISFVESKKKKGTNELSYKADIESKM